MWRIGFFVMLAVAIAEAVLLALRSSVPANEQAKAAIDAEPAPISSGSGVEATGPMLPQGLNRTEGTDPSAAWVKRLLELKHNRQIVFDVRLFDPTGVMNPALAELLGLTPEQHEAVATVLGQTKALVQSFIETNAKVSRTSDGVIEVTLTGRSDAGQLHDELLANVRQMIGEEKYGAFVSLIGDSIETSFDYFGARDRVITINPKKAAGGRTEFHLEDRFRVGPTWGTSNSQFIDRNHLRQYLGVHADRVFEKL